MILFSLLATASLAAGPCLRLDKAGTAVSGDVKVCPGRYRVEVRRQAKDLLTVPSMEGEEVYTRLGPGEKGPIVVDIKPGTNLLNLAIRTQ